MGKKHIDYLLIIMSSAMVFIFGIIFIKNMNSSYAYEVNRPSYPSSTFNTDFNSSKINYISEALTRNGASSELSNNFSVPSNMKIASTNNTLYLLHKNLEIPGSTEKFEIIAENPTTINDPGIMYIISHGYNSYNNLNTIFTESSKYGTASDNEKYYVTQIALWLYLAEKESSFTDICKNNACKFYKGTSTATSTEIRKVISDCSAYNGYEYLEYITDLTDNAKAYRGGDSSSKISSSNPGESTYTINDDFSLLTTSLSTPTVTSNRDNFMYYTFEIEDPDSIGLYLTDNNGRRLSASDSYGNGFSFKINAPLKEDLERINLKNAKVHVIGHFMIDTEIRNYHVTSSPNGLILPAPLKSQKYSNVLFAYAQDETAELIFTLQNFVTVSKIDITNSKELPGANLKITKKGEDAAVEAWTSTNKPRYFSLENGDYQLCETAAPSGYQKKTECIDFSYDGSHIVSLTMENEPTVDVDIPDTGLFKGYLKYIFGFLLICSGLGVFIVSYKKTNN